MHQWWPHRIWYSFVHATLKIPEVSGEKFEDFLPEMGSDM